MHLNFHGGNRQAKCHGNLLVSETLVRPHQDRCPVHLREFLQSTQNPMEFILGFRPAQNVLATVGNRFVEIPRAQGAPALR